MADKPKRPSPPTDVQVDGRNASDGMATKELHRVHVSAKIFDPEVKHETKLLVQYSSNNFKTHKTVRSDFGKQGRRQGVMLSGLKVDTLYKLRLWTVAKPDRTSKQHTTTSFWTNRRPVVELVDPAENAEIEEYIPATNPPEPTQFLFDWRFIDPDDQPDDPRQKAYQIQYWAEGGKRQFIGWVTGNPGKATFHRVRATSLVANTTYYWTVRAKDPAGLTSQWALTRSFFLRGASSPPELVDPIKGEARIADETIRFTWKFRDPVASALQVQADIRWRAVGTEEWATKYGEGVTPGTTMQWDIAPGHFAPGFVYEWQVRTYNDKEEGVPSGWSQAKQFVAAVSPGSALTDPPLTEETDPMGALGCGHHRVFVYDRGGRVLRGEIKPIQRLLWTRRRDDIGNCVVDTNGFDQDCCALLGDLQSWAHELVVFRDGIRVFEGPITRITYTSASVEVEAKDVMAYLYRRVMRQGYNDAYRRVDLTPKTPSVRDNPPASDPTSGTQRGGPYLVIGQNTVVDRALQITLNALAYQDPNVLPYVTAIRNADDATQTRIVPDYSRTAWEEIDDLAATAGLDYTTVGRRILYWDTHRMIGRLPEMRDGDFSDPVIVTEYGMQTANWFAVTNNSGIAGIAYPVDHDETNWFEKYGPVEMLSSAYNEQQAATVSTQPITNAARAELEERLRGQARKGIANRWPNPVVVRVPDNSTLNPQINLDINQLVPGVWIPLRATLTCRKLSQWQKLDAVDVEETAGTEAIRVTMSPAPHGGEDDPDLSGQVDGA